LAWRKPLDDWLAQLAIEVRRVVSFKLALIGFEVDEDEVLVQKARRAGVVMANDTYERHLPTRDLLAGIPRSLSDRTTSRSEWQVRNRPELCEDQSAGSRSVG